MLHLNGKWSATAQRLVVTHIRRFVRRLVTLVRSGKAESDLAREMTAHLQLLEDQFVACRHERGGRAVRGAARIRRRRAGERTPARRARVPLARRLADGPEARAAHARQVARRSRSSPSSRWPWPLAPARHISNSSTAWSGLRSPSQAAIDSSASSSATSRRTARTGAFSTTSAGGETSSRSSKTSAPRRILPAT